MRIPTAKLAHRRWHFSAHELTLRITALASVIDPYIEQNGELNGLMLEARSFPGWENFAALPSHLRFVRDHHRRIERIAVVTDSALPAAAPKIA